MFVALLDDEDFETLPAEAEARWVALEAVARDKLVRHLNGTNARETRPGQALIMQYMKIVSEAARELGIEETAIPKGTRPTDDVESFMVKAQAIAVGIKLRLGPQNERFSFKLEDNTKSEIRDLASKILDAIPGMKLAEHQEQRLKRSMIAFLEELELPRSRFSLGSGFLMNALTVVSMSVATVATAPDAKRNLEELIWIWTEAHEASEAERKRLPYSAPQALLAPPVKQIGGPAKAQDEN